MVAFKHSYYVMPYCLAEHYLNRKFLNVFFFASKLLMK